MTTSLERTRAVLHTREFLAELARNLDLPQKVRADARHLLRHFPEQHNFYQESEEFASCLLLKNDPTASD
jgi:hypothetical protein